MLFCPHCQQLESTTPQRHTDGTVTYLCKKCGGSIPLRRELRPGEVVAGFEIQEELGRGAMGIVYQARQTNLDREVAIKILSDDSASDEVYVERFFREARAAASLSHPNVVQAYDAGVTADGIYYFVMERINGENLDLVLNNVGPLNVPQALNVFLAVANALSYAWTRNQLSHGDIKPENIIMRLNGKVKLADFGLARRAKDPDLADEDIRATPAYAPPEIIRGGDKDVPGFKSDMYSFGATAYHILIGHEPFVGTDPAKVCAMQLSDIQVPLYKLNRNIPRRLSDLVDALMAKDPENRPETWDAVIAELQAIRQEVEAASVPGTESVKANAASAPRKRSSAILVVAFVIFLLVVAAIVAAFLLPRKEPGRNGSSSAGNVDTPSVPSSQKPKITYRPESGQVRDEAYYRSRWQSLLSESGGARPRLDQVEQFVSEAGDKAPNAAITMLKKLREERNRVLELREALLKQVASFDSAQMDKVNAAKLTDLYQSVQTRFNELKRLDDARTEKLFLQEDRKTVEAYLKKISDLQKAKTSAAAQNTTPASADTGTKPEKTKAPEADSDNGELMTAYQSLLECLPKTIRNESERTEALRVVDELLKDNRFKGEIPRRNCAGIRRFLILNKQAMLSHLVSNENALRGMKLFPKACPNSVLAEIKGSTFRMRLPDTKANIQQSFAWDKLRKDEGEDRIIVTLINSSQLAKLSVETREYLFVRALFLGVDPDQLKKRYDRASSLSDAKRNELNTIAGLFRESDLDEED